MLVAVLAISAPCSPRRGLPREIGAGNKTVHNLKLRCLRASQGRRLRALSELALKLDEPEGQLQHSLVVWLKQARDEKQNLNKLTVERFITDNQQAVIDKNI
ncbi:hypothetical protein ID853_18640 [Xenorhabdus sp. Vera]|nr:hypothetical protein [Xenorhabdus sp. Vera]